MRRKPVQLLGKSLNVARGMGYAADSTERVVPGSHTKRDLFSLFDMVLVGRGVVIGVQVTTQAHASDRYNKMLANPVLQEWLAVPGARAHVWGWSRKSRVLKDGRKSARKFWELTITNMVKEDAGLN